MCLAYATPQCDRLWLGPGNPGEGIGSVRTRGPVGLTKDMKATIHVSVDRDLTHKAGLWLLVGRPVW